jgi:hypothetical protein
MASGVTAAIRSDIGSVAQDFLVAGLGAITSIITAVILAAIELRFDLSIYSWMVWFIIPVGAICCGFVAASGYYLGARLFNHRPTGILLLNMVAISIATFFLIHYLDYFFLEIDGKAVRDLISFSQFLDIEMSHTAVQFNVRAHPVGGAVQLGTLGYLYALLQMLGFAFGGVGVYLYLKSLPYCDSCSKYLAKKGIQTRYTAHADVLTEAVKEIMQRLSEKRFQEAIAVHSRAAGVETFQKELVLRSQMQIKKCKSCDQHWLKFSVSKKTRDDWKDITELGYESFCAEPINVVTATDPQRLSTGV